MVQTSGSPPGMFIQAFQGEFISVQDVEFTNSET